MNEPKLATQAVFSYHFTVPQEAIDRNGHVNNVVYIQWMQDVAMRHSEATGGTAAMEAISSTWVVRSHQIEYFSPAFVGDDVEISTWVVNCRRVRSLRRYKFVRVTDEKLLARGETDWVFVSDRGRPLAIPEAVKAAFPLVPNYE